MADANIVKTDLAGLSQDELQKVARTPVKTLSPFIDRIRVRFLKKCLGTR
jgi:hypothetical protein